MAIPWWGYLLAGAATGAVAGATAPQEQPSYEQEEEYREKAWDWATGYSEEYPEFPGMPGQVDQMGQRLTEMLGGELSPAVQQYLGYKYNQAWQSAQAGYADIGAGPGTLASQKIQMGQQQAIQGAYMGQEQIAKGMEYMPQYTQMMMSPYGADVMKWQNIANLMQQNFPGEYEVPGGGTTTTQPTGGGWQGGLPGGETSPGISDPYAPGYVPRGRWAPVGGKSTY